MQPRGHAGRDNIDVYKRQAGKNFALLVEELLEELGILVVDILDAATFETAVFFLFCVDGKGLSLIHIS